MEDKRFTFKVKTDSKELFEFMMYHNYVSLRGILSVTFSVVAFIGIIIFRDITIAQRLFLMLFALMFTVISPFEYYIRSRRQAKKSFENELQYTFDDEGITVQINDLSSVLPWEDVIKVVSTKHLVLIYSTPVRAYILPKKDIGRKFAQLKAYMEKKTDCYKFKME